MAILIDTSVLVAVERGRDRPSSRAATAIAQGLEVLALDGDFDRIPGVQRAAI